jgi:leukotriene-A4 hydrolase
LTNTKDPECKQRWFPLGIKYGYTPTMEKAHEFISSQGRLKYLNPIYRSLIESGQKDLAIKWFKENEDFYHPLAVNSLSKLLGLDKEDKSLLEKASDFVADFV